MAFLLQGFGILVQVFDSTNLNGNERVEVTDFKVLSSILSFDIHLDFFGKNNKTTTYFLQSTSHISFAIHISHIFVLFQSWYHKFVRHIIIL